MADDEFMKKPDGNSDDIDDASIEDVLEKVPEEQRKVIERFMISSVQMRSVASPEAAVMKNITSEHITKYLEGAEQDMRNSYAEKMQKKIFVFLTMLVSMIFFIFVIVLLKDIPDVMEKVIYAIGGVVAGAFGGYGLGKKQSGD